MQTDYYTNVLMIEDNECDVEIVTDIFNRSHYSINLSVMNNAEDALDFLYKKGENSTSYTPNLIFLDLNLPQMGGIEFLDNINKNDHLRMIPTIVMTTSNNYRDIINSYQRCVSCYVTKPIDIDEFETLVMDLAYIWLRIAKSPIGLK